MSNEIIRLQETLSHQGEEIARLSDELYTQQKEIAALRGAVSALHTKLKAVTDEGAGVRSIDQETPPPHY